FVVGFGIILYMLSAISIVPLTSQYIVSRLSLSLKVNNSTNISVVNVSNACNGSILGPEQIKIQKEASLLSLYYALTSGVAAIAINLILGPLSDFIGRRILFIIPIVGLFLKCVITSLIVYFDLNLNLMYLASAVDGLCGSYYAILVASFTYSADVTVPGKNRTVAIACMEGCLAVAASVGALSSGFLIKSTGYFYPVLMFAIAAAINLTLTFFCLPETLTEKKQPEKSPLYHIKKVFGFYFSNGSKRLLYSVLMGMFFFGVVVVLGRTSLETIYQLGEPFCWNSVKIGYFGALRLTVQFSCSILSIKFLQNYFKDEYISILSIPVVGIIGSSTVPIARSLMSKMTPPEKQGALFASIAIVETVCNSASNSLYNLVYNATVEHFKGAVWFMMAGFCIIAIM
ncbi:hypothetical protein LOTGIDRAFT_73586, partial [Lottia gigantea]